MLPLPQRSYNAARNNAAARTLDHCDCNYKYTTDTTEFIISRTHAANDATTAITTMMKLLLQLPTDIAIDTRILMTAKLQLLQYDDDN